MLYDYVKKYRPDAIVKGVRNASDFFYEMEQNDYNRSMCGVNTVLLPASPGMESLSSTLARTVSANGGRLEGILPQAAIEAIQKINK